MKISIGENRELLLEEVFTGILLRSRDGEELGVCMRDSGFEISYEGKWFSAKEGRIEILLVPSISKKSDLPQTGTEGGAR